MHKSCDRVVWYLNTWCTYSTPKSNLLGGHIIHIMHTLYVQSFFVVVVVVGLISVGFEVLVCFIFRNTYNPDKRHNNTYANITIAHKNEVV